jgi:transcriptional regulator with XRE-family HTH domain
LAYTRQRTFGQVVRDRRRQLNLTQEEVARRIKTSTPYVGHLETDKRHPSERVISRLAWVLDLDQRELFFLANPQTEAFLSARAESDAASVWDRFSKDDPLRRAHNISGGEMEMLSRVPVLGDVRSPREFIYILNSVRHALGR